MINPITLMLAALLCLCGIGIAGFAYPLAGVTHPVYAIPFFAAALLVVLSLKMANTWQEFVVLRAGKLQDVRGPGLFLMFPVIDRVVAVIDERIQTTAFNAEQALTKDTVPVNVDAIIFWHVNNAEAAALKITNYREAIDRVAQTSLREMIGSSMLAALLSDRKAADEQLRAEIGAKTAAWGVSVTSVEVRDVAIPGERPECGGIRRPMVIAGPYWMLPRTDCRSHARTRRCRPHIEPAAASELPPIFLDSDLSDRRQ